MLCFLIHQTCYHILLFLYDLSESHVLGGYFLHKLSQFLLYRFRLVPHFGHDEGQIVFTFYLVYFLLDVGNELVEVILQLPWEDSYLFNRYILLVEQFLDDPSHTVEHIQT